MSGMKSVFFDDVRAYLKAKGLPMEAISDSGGYLRCGEK